MAYGIIQEEVCKCGNKFITIRHRRPLGPKGRTAQTKVLREAAAGRGAFVGVMKGSEVMCEICARPKPKAKKKGKRKGKK